MNADMYGSGATVTIRSDRESGRCGGEIYSVRLISLLSLLSRFPSLEIRSVSLTL